MRRWRVGWIGAAAVLPLLGQTAHAAIRTFTVTGTVNQITDSKNQLEGAVDVGQLFSTAYSFDSATADLFPADSTFGRYPLTPPLTMSAGGLSLNSPAPAAYIDVSKTSYAVFGHFTSTPYEIHEFDLVLSSGVPNALPNDQLPLAPPNPSLYGLRYFFFHGNLAGQTEQFLVGGTITSITPEPGSLVLIIGWLTLSMCARKHKRLHPRFCKGLVLDQ